VQSYTHPLWMFLLALYNYLAGEEYYSTLLLSLETSVLAVMVFSLGLAGSAGRALLGVMLLVFSKAFMDYSTSGLENPLTHLLLALFLLVFLHRPVSLKGLFQLSLIAGLATTNRMDVLLLVFPALAYRFWEQRSVKALAVLAAGFAPFALWEAFSCFYYGFPFPNTAYAKMFVALGPGQTLRMGLAYFLVSLRLDYVTLPVIAAGLAVGLMDRSRRLRPLALGMGLYLLYLVQIGGDFMCGRFLAAPLLVAAGILMQMELWSRRSLALGGVLAVLVAGVISPLAPPFQGAGYGVSTAIEYRFDFGVCDERAYYYPFTGLLAVGLDSAPPVEHQWACEGRALRQRGERFWIAGAIGFISFEAGPSLHLLDIQALTDPLLARLPPLLDPEVVPGHFPRRIPAGYCDTLLTGQNHLRDPALSEYYQKLALVVRGPLWDRGRLAEILNLNLGKYDPLLQQYLHSPLALPLAVTYHELPVEPAPAPDLTPMAKTKALQIDFNRTAYLRYLKLSLDTRDMFEFVYLREGQEVGRQRVQLSPAVYQDSHTTLIPVVPAAGQEGFNRLRIYQLEGDGRFHCQLHLRLCGE